MNTKPDLPGRVSFSKSGVYEVNMSDDNDDASTNNSTSPTTTKQINNTTDAVLPTKEHMDNVLDTTFKAKEMEDNRSCCSLKCNSLLETTNPVETDETKTSEGIDSSYQPDESERIIDEYRREIEKINHQHDQELASIHNNLKSQTNLVSSIECTLPKNNASSPEFPNDNQEVISKIISNAWKNHQSTLKSTEHKSYAKQSIFDSPIAANAEKRIVENIDTKMEPTNDTNSTTKVIDNYLKTIHQKPLMASSPLNQSGETLQKSIKQTNNTNGQNSNISSSQSKPISKQSAKRNISSASKLKTTSEDKRLNEFQIEKVESWMSIHEFSDQKDVKADNSHVDKIYNQSWRDTPTSKTDDEGMFSFDDQLDGAESTYDDIVSVIKEIDDQRNHDLGIYNK